MVYISVCTELKFLSNFNFTIKDACVLYSLRWRIECIFKTWKSNFNFDNIHSVSQIQLKVLLHARFITITSLYERFSYRTIPGIICYGTSCPIVSIIRSCGCACEKTIETITNRVRKFASIFIQKQGSLKDCLNNFYETIINVNMLECKGEDPMFLKIITECISC